MSTGSVPIGATPRSRRAAGGAYLAAILVGTVALALSVKLTVEWTGTSEGSLLVNSLVLLTTIASAVVLWTRSTIPRQRAGLVPVVILAMLFLWILLVTLSVLRGESLAIPALVMPFFLVLVWFKPPLDGEAARAADAFAWALVGAVLLTIGLESAGVLPHWSGAEMALWEHNYYWLWLADLLQLPGRWAGPFVHPNLAGPVGAFLVVFGLTRPGARRWVFVSAGILVLLVSASRTAQISAAAGVCTLAAVWWLRRPGRPARWIRVIVLALPVVALTVVLATGKSGFVGRAEIWPEMWRLWRSSPALGVGDAGFVSDIEAGLLPDWAIHAHNLFLDAGVRTGLVGLLAVCALLVLALVACVRGAIAGRAVGLALVVTLVVGSLGDVTIHWRYPEVTTLALLLAVLMSAASPGDPEPLSEPGPTAPATPREQAQVPGTGQDPDPAPTP